VECARAWHEAYKKTVAAIAKDPKTARKWDFDIAKSGIFSQIDAFVQRCDNLHAVCEGIAPTATPDPPDRRRDPTRYRRLRMGGSGQLLNELMCDGRPLVSLAPSPPCTRTGQLQFARKRSKGGKAEMPHFPGSKGADTQKSLMEIEDRFAKHLEKLASLAYGLWDFKIHMWHFDYSNFKHGLEEAEKMMANVLQTAWEGVATVKDAVELLEAFDSLAKRQSMARDLRPRARTSPIC
jgi:hypothetical protein